MRHFVFHGGLHSDIALTAYGNSLCFVSTSPVFRTINTSRGEEDGDSLEAPFSSTIVSHHTVVVESSVLSSVSLLSRQHIPAFYTGVDAGIPVPHTPH